MNRQNLMQLSGALAALMALFAVLGQPWAVYPMTACGLAWFALWLTKPGALRCLLYGLIAFFTLR